MENDNKLTIEESQSLVDVLNELDSQLYCNQINKLKKHIERMKNDEKVCFHIEDVFHLDYEIKQLNSFNLDEIEFYENGQKIEIPKNIIEDFKYTGLGNMDFIRSGFYKTGWI